MASKPVAPTLDSGFVDVPLVSTAVPTATATSYPLKAQFCNTTDDPINITLTDTAGGKVMDARPVPPHGEIEKELDYMPMVGMKWFASATGLTGKAWGYTSWPF